MPRMMRKPIAEPIAAMRKPLPTITTNKDESANDFLSPRSEYKQHGHPTAFDHLGRALFTHPADGKLVYLECCIKGCGQNNFKTVHGLMCHISGSGKTQHGIEGLILGHTDALRRCGRVVPSQEELVAAEDRSGLGTDEVSTFGSSPDTSSASKRSLESSQGRSNVRSIKHKASKDLLNSSAGNQEKSRAFGVEEHFAGLWSSEDDIEKAERISKENAAKRKGEKAMTKEAVTLDHTSLFSDQATFPELLDFFEGVKERKGKAKADRQKRQTMTTETPAFEENSFLSPQLGLMSGAEHYDWCMRDDPEVQERIARGIKNVAQLEEETAMSSPSFASHTSSGVGALKGLQTSKTEIIDLESESSDTDMNLDFREVPMHSTKILPINQIDNEFDPKGKLDSPRSEGAASEDRAPLWPSVQNTHCLASLGSRATNLRSTNTIRKRKTSMFPLLSSTPKRRRYQHS